ncbi:MAG: hypothetical protein JST69_14130 [Bacteroidetes bacterium]|nr:hypothetical protein [Bacteroidota bacterium]
MKPSKKQIEKIDQFFKNKLEEHSIAPPENTWSLVEAGLPKKNSKWVWSIAAGILLAALLLILIYQPHQPENTTLTLSTKSINQAPDPIAQEKEASKPEIIRVEKNTHINMAQDALPSKSIQKRIPARKETGISLNKKEERNKKTTVVTVPEDIEIKQEKIKIDATHLATVASSTQQPMKLEFTLDDFPAKETVATTVAEKKSGLKKFLELARDIKTGEGSAVDLKDIKNEIFASNLLSRKKNN